jgi:nicotinamide phosphoribosyltransferase
LVVRPDSGDPKTTLLKILDTFETLLGKDVININSKGYKVLPPYLRIIWGDGINRRSFKEILGAVLNAGWSASNLAFGSGGGLLMDFNRDTQRFAFKCSYAIVGGKAVNVSKDPITDPGKRSKEGRLDLIKVNDQYVTVALDENVDQHPNSVLVTYFEQGNITYHTTLAECRQRMAI